MFTRSLAVLALLGLGTLLGFALATGGLTTVSMAQAAQQPGATDEKKAEAPTEKETPLHTLDWLEGDWVDTSDEVQVEFSCHFTKNRAFLIRSFRVVTKAGVGMSGMQVIAWDPVQENIRSWTYDSDGGFGEETWTQSGDRYTIRAKYTLPDGGVGSALHVMTYLDDNRFQWRSMNREIDGELQPDSPELTITRKAVAQKEGN